VRASSDQSLYDIEGLLGGRWIGRMHGVDHQKGALEVHLEEGAPYRLGLVIAMDNYGLLVQQARFSCFFVTL
jgi:hypothetical protein